MVIPVNVDLGLSTRLYQREQKWKWVERYSKGKKVWRRQRVAENVTMQVSVSGAIYLSALSLYLLLVYTYKDDEISWNQALMWPVDYLLNAIQTIAASLSNAIAEVIPDLPTIPSPASIGQRILTGLPNPFK